MKYEDLGFYEKTMFDNIVAAKDNAMIAALFVSMSSILQETVNDLREVKRQLREIQFRTSLNVVCRTHECS